MGTATGFAPQTIRAPRVRGHLQNVLSQIGRWLFQAPETDENVDHLSTELRNDIGLEPKLARPQPFGGWQP